MVTRVDLLGFSNNADLSHTFDAVTGGTTPPWSTVAPWSTGEVYDSDTPSVVTYNGDLYMASGAASSWAAGPTFSEESDYWTLIARAATWKAAPISLTGASLKMVLAPVADDGVSPVVPVVSALTLTSATNGGLTLSGSQINLYVPAVTMKTLTARSYAYDLLAITTVDGVVTSTRRLFCGVVSVAQGVS